MTAAALLTLAAFTPALLLVVWLAAWPTGCETGAHSVDALSGQCHACDAQVLDPIEATS